MVGHLRLTMLAASLALPLLLPGPMPPTTLIMVTAAHAPAQTQAAGGFPVAWGNNAGGQLGTTACCAPANTPHPVNGLTGVVSIAGGGQHSVAARSDGTVWEWGRCCGLVAQVDSFCQCRRYPTAVAGLSGIVAVAAGGEHSLALKADGTVWAWGDDYYGQLGTETPPPRQSCGQYRCGAPVQVSGLRGVVKIAAQGYLSLALKADGTVWDWGDTLYGGTALPRQVPVPGHAVALAAGIDSLIATADGHVWTWNRANSGSPMEVPGPGGAGSLNDVVAVAAGFLNQLALKADGTVWTWSSTATATTADRVPHQVASLNHVSAIAADDLGLALALRSDGTVWAWGQNGYGQLGNGTWANSAIPVQVKGLQKATAIAAGSTHSLASSSSAVHVSPPPVPAACTQQPTVASPGNAFPRTIRVGSGVESLAVSEQAGHAFALVPGPGDASGSLCAGRVTMLDARKGVPLQTVRVGRGPGAMVVAERTGRVFVFNQGDVSTEGQGSMSLLDGRTGRVLHTMPMQPVWGVVVSQATERVFVQTWTTLPWAPAPGVIPRPQSIRMLDARSGAVLRVFPLTGLPLTGLLAVDERQHRLLILNQDGLTMLDAGSGALLRTVSMAGCPPQGDELAVYRVDYGGLVVDEQTERVFVAVTTGDFRDGYHYFTCVLDARSGRVLTVVKGDGTGGLLVDDHAGVVLAGQTSMTPGPPPPSGRMLILSARDGSVLRRLNLQLGGNGTFGAVDQRTGRIYFVSYPWGTGTGTESLLDPQGWRIVGTMHLGPYPTAIDVAQRARRVFIASGWNGPRAPGSGTVTVLCADTPCTSS